MTSPDDLAPQLVPALKPAVRYGQGTIRSWNPDTFANEIDWRGVRLVNLPVLAATDALTFQPGDEVGLLGWDAGGRRGTGDWWILGRLIVPGAGRAEQAIEFLTSELAKVISAQVFAERVHTATVNAQETRANSASFGDLATVGPTVSGVEISAAGRALVLVSAKLRVDSGFQTGLSSTLNMSFEVSGATSIAAASTRGREIYMLRNSAAQIQHAHGDDSAGAVWMTLNPGVHTFEAKYRFIEIHTPGGDPVGQFSDRVLTVIAF